MLFHGSTGNTFDKLIRNAFLDFWNFELHLFFVRKLRKLSISISGPEMLGYFVYSMEVVVPLS